MRFGKIDIPEDLSYTKNHLWVKIEDSLCMLGWTDYIQSNAGDVNYVELPGKGTPVEVGKDFGTIETSKWVDRLYSPVNGRVVDVNDEVVRNPELINNTPFTKGWLLRIERQGETGSEGLMSPMEYFEFIQAAERAEHGIT